MIANIPHSVRHSIEWSSYWLDRWNDQILRNRVYAGPYHAEIEATMLAEKIRDAKEILFECRDACIDVLGITLDQWTEIVAVYAPDCRQPIGMQCGLDDDRC
jgi:hypothetical protein